MQKNYIRHSVITNIDKTLTKIKEVIDNNGDSINLNGVNVHINRKKLRVYTEKGYKCCCCGEEANFIAIEKSIYDGNRWILHLYISKNEKEKMLTRDHIFPVSRGGLGDVSNLQPMCAKCNAKKSDKIFYKDIVNNEQNLFK